MTQSKVLEIIDYNFITKHRSPAKLKAVSKASSKFINKYKGKHNVDYTSVIDYCLQMYDEYAKKPFNDLEVYPETFFIK